MTDNEYIKVHQHDDVRQLALQRSPEDIDLKWCLTQIEGYQIAERKLPLWAKTDGIWYPPRLSMEQCSSQHTATYKRQIAERLIPADEREAMTDLTGGLGVDFSYLAPLFRHSTYVEQQPHLVDLAKHNLPLLGLSRTEIANSKEFNLSQRQTLIYVDPSRRDKAGRKTVVLEDCSPNLLELQELWAKQTRYVMVKLSPMLDIAQALRQLHGVTEVHTVSVEGECKELLLVIEPGTTTEPRFFCIDLPNEHVFTCSMSQRNVVPQYGEPSQGCLLFEPNTSLLKAACQDAYALQHGLKKLHPQSNLYVAPYPSSGNYPLAGRSFRLDSWSDFSKSGLRSLLADVKQANLSIRNFPSSVAELRKRLRLLEGGNTYLFATTLTDGRHALLRCSKSVSH